MPCATDQRPAIKGLEESGNRNPALICETYSCAEVEEISAKSGLSASDWKIVSTEAVEADFYLRF
jgi:hypothetical protein